MALFHFTGFVLQWEFCFSFSVMFSLLVFGLENCNESMLWRHHLLVRLVDCHSYVSPLAKIVRHQIRSGVNCVFVTKNSFFSHFQEV